MRDEGAKTTMEVLPKLFNRISLLQPVASGRRLAFLPSTKFKKFKPNYAAIHDIHDKYSKSLSLSFC